MGTSIVWAHGNALTVESPENLEPGGWHYGWGADLTIKSGLNSWFHIPVTVPAKVDDFPVRLLRVFLLIETEGGAEVRNVHLYDGSRLLQTFDGLSISGNYRIKIVTRNTFQLRDPRTVSRGISVSFFVQGGAHTGGQQGVAPNHIVVTSVGAEYQVVRPRLHDILTSATSAVGRIIDRITGKGP
jgi:hypothetical protein